MGGYGSGRQYGANCTDDYRWIDIRRWQRDGLISSGQQIDWQWLQNGEKVASIGARVETDQIRLNYSYQRHGEERENLDYPVSLQTTVCHYGGLRYWFTCPAVGCGRRVAVMYLGGKYFACRHCYRLAYRSQRETDDDRASRKADKIRDKLKWDRGILNTMGGKPKGMHWKTYYRVWREYHKVSDQVLLGISKRLGIVNDWLSFLSNRK
ncbi:MAG: hypothetical protein HOO93_17135 [Methyloglobulus sp.]|nr:hypothetical protein [Methyloglobulus sp.]